MTAAEWSGARTELDTGADTPPVAPETPEAPPVATPTAPEPSAPGETPVASPADQIVAGLVKAGMTDTDAKALWGKASTPEPIKDALEAFLDGKAYPVPKGLTFKLKSGAVVTEKSLEQLQKEGMLYNDYQVKTQDVARQRRDLEARLAQANAQLAAAKVREDYVREQEAEMIAAQKDPKKWEAWQQYQHQYQTNPMFRKMADDALKNRETQAELGTYREQEDARFVQDGTQWALNAITEMGKEFPTVDPDRVRERYGSLVANGKADLTATDLRTVFQYEQDYLNRVQSPVNAKIEELQAQIATLTSTKAADKHNAGTAHALERSRAVPTSPAGGGPPAPARAPERKPIAPTRQDHDRAVADWAAVRE